MKSLIDNSPNNNDNKNSSSKQHLMCSVLVARRWIVPAVIIRMTICHHTRTLSFYQLSAIFQVT